MEFIVEDHTVIHPIACVITAQLVVHLLSAVFHRYEDFIISHRYVDYAALLTVSACVLASCGDVIASGETAHNGTYVGAAMVTVATLSLTLHYVVEDSMGLDTYLTLGCCILELLNLGSLIIITSVHHWPTLYIALLARLSKHYGEVHHDEALVACGESAFWAVIVCSVALYPCVDVRFMYLLYFTECLVFVNLRIPPIWCPLVLAMLGMKALGISLHPHTVKAEGLTGQIIAQNFARC